MTLSMLIGLWFLLSVPVSLLGARIASMGREPEYAWYAQSVRSDWD